MSGRKPIDLKVLLFVAALVLVVTSAVAVFFAVSYTPGGSGTDTTTVQTTPTVQTKAPVPAP